MAIGVVLMGLVFAAPVRAQMCDTLFEVIVTLRQPTFGVPTVWDAHYGSRDYMYQLASGIPMEGGTVFAVGRKLSKDDFKPLELVMVELNRRGRALKEEHFEAKDAEVPVKMLRVGNRFLVASNQLGGKQLANRQVRISWYDMDGKYKKDQLLQDSAFNYEVVGMEQAIEERGFVLVVHAVNKNDQTDQHGLLMRFNESGTLIWKRAYRPGIPNKLQNIIPIDDKSYLAMGRIRMDDGRQAGWVMKLGYDGTILWQRTYPRGQFSLLRHAAVRNAGNADRQVFLLIGDARPVDGNPDAAWIMALDSLGEPKWQRYFRRDDTTFSGGWVGEQKDDGRVTVILNAKGEDGSDAPDHVRMLTMSPRGVIISDEAYITGLEAEAKDFVRGWNNERVVIANTQIDTAPANEMENAIMSNEAFGPLTPNGVEEQEEGEILLKGWVFVATALDPYDDPCGDDFSHN